MLAQVIFFVSGFILALFVALKVYEAKNNLRFFAEFRDFLDTKTNELFLRFVNLIQNFNKLNISQKLKVLTLFSLSVLLKLFAVVSAKVSKYLHLGARRLNYNAKSKITKQSQ